MGWRQNTRAIIRQYPALKRKERELREVSSTVKYGTSARPGCPSGNARTVEAAAIRQLPTDEQRALDAVSAAIQTTMRYRNGSLRVKLIDLIYWRETHNLTGGAMAIHVSVQTARLWHNGFVELVDAYMRVL